MTAPIFNTKSTLREQIRARLKSIPATTRVTAAAQLCGRLQENEIWRRARSVLFFAPMRDEPDVWPLLEKVLATKKTYALPFFDSVMQIYSARRVQNLTTDISIGKFGIREPAPHCVEMPLDDLDLVLVPGVAFDLRGHRLGRGQGFYDRWLANFAGVKTGIAFEEQLVEMIPAGKRDVPMNFVLTPKRCVRCET